MNTRIIGTILSRSVSALLLSSYLLDAQPCVVGTNQADYLMNGGDHVAWPKNGSRVQAGASWISMPASGIQYVYCPAWPNPICASPGGGDANFTGSQQTSMESAFSAWISAKTANGSNLSFNQLFSSTYGTDPFVIAIRSMSPTSMGTALGRFVTQGMALMDYNNDGVGDEDRLADAVIEIRSNVTTQMTAVLVHELGHTFGMDDCVPCNSTTIMKSTVTTLTAPAACDNAKVASIM